MLTSERKKPKRSKIRYAEYYDLQKTLDSLYADSLKGKVFVHLMELISSEENIRMAYRTIKGNTGSSTAGVDKRTIQDLAKLNEEKYVALIPFDFMTSTAAGDRLRKYMKLSDVDYTPGDGKGFHSFRRYVASSMINQEVPIDIVKEILGHTQIGSMKAYMRISRDKLAMCALGLDGIEVIQEALL